MKMITEEVYKVDPDEARVMRLDVAADIPVTPVEWFRNHTHVRGKQVHRQWSTQSLTTRRAETLYSGQKPNQIRIYDKTAHRAMLLQKEILRMPKEARDVAMNFEQRWGYPQSQVVTRVERQIGGPAPKRIGMGLVSQLVNLDSIDPFTQIIFPDDWKRKPTRNLKGLAALKEEVFREFLADMVKRDGVVHTQNYLHRTCIHKTQYYRVWNTYGGFLAALADEGSVTRKGLLESFRSTIYQQLKQAA